MSDEQNQDNLPVYQVFDGFQLTPIGLLVTGTPTFDAWQATFPALTDLSEGSQWGLGDWLAYGEGRGDWGETYTQAVDMTKKSYSTLSKLVWVAKVFAYVRRRRTLSFSHHVEVAKMEMSEQDAWLDQAELNGWSRDELRDAIKAAKGDQPEPMDLDSGGSKLLECGHPKACAEKSTGDCRWCADVATHKFAAERFASTLAEIISGFPGIKSDLSAGAKAVWDEVEERTAGKKQEAKKKAKGKHKDNVVTMPTAGDDNKPKKSKKVN